MILAKIHFILAKIRNQDAAAAKLVHIFFLFFLARFRNYMYLCTRKLETCPAAMGLVKGNRVEIPDSTCCCDPHLRGLLV